MSLVANAEAFARLRHAGQIRKGAASEPYTVHLEEVAELVSSWGGAEVEIAAAWLHDTVEDCPPTSLEELKLKFGSKVADLVAELTDDKSLPKDERKRLQTVNALKKSASACLVTLADKSSNVAAISHSPPADWSLERRLEYIEWAKSVVDGLQHKPAAAEDEFFKRCYRAQLDSVEALGSFRQGQDMALKVLEEKCRRSGSSEEDAQRFLKSFIASNLERNR